MPNVIILMVNFPEDFMNIFTLEPLCLQDAIVNGSNWSLAGHKKNHVRSTLPWAFFLCQHADVLFYMFGFSSPLHCLGGGDKQCNADKRKVRLFRPKKQLLNGAFNVAVSGLKKKENPSFNFEE